jgi:quercetin dioxygenase-like cupin family protein
MNTMTTLTTIPTVIPADDGERLEFFGEQATIKISGEQTGSAYAVLELITPPGGGPSPHVHDREDEVFLVQSGALRILANGQWQEVGPGSVVFAPRNHPHAYHNHGDKPCRFWLMVSPAGFENFYRELSTDAANTSAPDINRLRTIAERHGIHLME